MTGINRVDPALGSNGVGKSTLFDAITWALTGVTGGGLRGPGVVGAGHQTARVELSLADGRTLLRQQSPNRILWQGLEVEQAALERALPSDLWTLSVHHAQGAAFFTDLSPTERAEALATWLQVRVWDAATNAAKERRTGAQERAQEAWRAHAHALGLLEGTQMMRRNAAQALERARAALEAAQGAAHAQLQGVQRQLKVLQKQELTQAAELKILDEAIDKAEALLEEQNRATDTARDRARDYQSQLRTAQREVQVQEQELARVRSLTECPTCYQSVGDTHRAQIEATLLKRLTAQQAAVQRIRGNAERCQRGAEAMHATGIGMQRDWTALDQKRQGLLREHDEVLSKLEYLQQQVQDAADDSGVRQAARYCHEAEQAQAEVAERLAHAEQEAAARAAEYRAADAEATRWDRWAKHFPQIRVWALLRAVDHFNLVIPQFLSEVGLSGWAVRMELVAQRVQQRLDIFVTAPGQASAWPLNALSGGESQRVRLAAQLAFAALAAPAWGMEFWDEPSSYLSGSGVEDLMGVLRNHAKQSRRIVWVVDHHASDLAMDGVLTLIKSPTGVQSQWIKS